MTRISSSSSVRSTQTCSAWRVETARSVASLRPRSRGTFPSSASRGERGTTSRSMRALPADDPLAAVAAFGGAERRVDVGRVGDRVFLNNVSLGVYGRLVHRRERGRRRDEAFARLARARDVSLAGPPLDTSLPRRRSVDSRQRRAHLEQRVPRGADLARRTSAARRRRACALRRSRLPASALDRAHRAPVSDREQASDARGRRRRACSAHVSARATCRSRGAAPARAAGGGRPGR